MQLRGKPPKSLHRRVRRQRRIRTAETDTEAVTPVNGR